MLERQFSKPLVGGPEGTTALLYTSRVHGRCALQRCRLRLLPANWEPLSTVERVELPALNGVRFLISSITA